MDGLSIYDVRAYGEFRAWLMDEGRDWSFKNFRAFVQSRQSEPLEYLLNAIFSPSVHDDDDDMRGLYESWSDRRRREGPTP